MVAYFKTVSFYFYLDNLRGKTGLELISFSYLVTFPRKKSTNMKSEKVFLNE